MATSYWGGNDEDGAGLEAFQGFHVGAFATTADFHVGAFATTADVPRNQPVRRRTIVRTPEAPEPAPVLPPPGGRHIKIRD